MSDQAETGHSSAMWSLMLGDTRVIFPPEPLPIIRFDDGTDVFLDSFSGGPNPDGVLSHLVLRIVSADGTEERRSYTADKVRESA